MYDYLGSINFLLSQIGVSDVTSPDINTPDVAGAKKKLDEASIWLQKKGWYFNTEYCVEMKRDTNNEIAVPANTMKVLRADQYVIVRNNKLYSPRGSTYEFTRNVVGNRVMLLDWELMPPTPQDVIRFQAAKRYVLSELEDVAKAQELDGEMTDSLIQLKAEELEIKRHNKLASPTAVRILGGNRPYMRGGSRNPLFPGG